MKKLFVVLMLTSLISTLTFAESSASLLVRDLPGDYIGTDQLNRPCLVSVSLNKDSDFFYFNAASASEGKLIQLEGVPNQKLQQKIIDDTEWRLRNDRHFDAMIVSVNYYLHDNQVGGTKQEVSMMWWLPSLIPSSISLAEEQGNGFYVSNRKRIDCFGVKKK